MTSPKGPQGRPGRIAERGIQGGILRRGHPLVGIGTHPGAVAFSRADPRDPEKGGILALRLPDAKGLLTSLALCLYKISLGRIASPLSVLYQLDWHYKHFYGYDRRTAGRLLDANGFEVIGLRSENGFDYRSLDLRLDYISGNRFARKAVRGALGAVSILAKLLRKEDELVLIARKT